MAGGDEGALEALLREVRAEAQELEQRLSSLLDEKAAWDAARMTVRELRFLAKLAADVDGMLAAQDV